VEGVDGYGGGHACCAMRCTFRFCRAAIFGNGVKISLIIGGLGHGLGTLKHGSRGRHSSVT
jgi:hypothetical protein